MMKTKQLAQSARRLACMAALVLSACGGGQEVATEGSTSTATAAAAYVSTPSETGTRMQAMAVAPTTPLLLEDTVYALRSVGSPELVLTEQGSGSALSLATLPATAAVPETSRFRFVTDTEHLGCFFLQALRLGRPPLTSSPVEYQLRVNAATKALVWDYVAYLNYRPTSPAALLCPEAAADGRGVVMRLQADRTQVLRVVNGQVAFATESASSAFGVSTAFQAVALEHRAVRDVPIITYNPAMFQGGTVGVGTAFKLQAEASSADGIESVTFRDDSAPGLLPPEDLAVRTTAPYTLDWTPTVGRHRISIWAKSKSGVWAWTEVNEVVVTGANVAPRVLLSLPTEATVGFVNTYFGALDPDGRLARVELMEGNEVLFRRDTTEVMSLRGEQVWLEAGRHTLTVRATDDSGAFALSAPQVVNVVALPYPAPEAVWLSPAQGGVMRSDMPLTLRASARDVSLNGIASGTVVAVRDGQGTQLMLGTQLGRSTLSGEFQFEVPAGTLEPGSYSLYFSPMTTGFSATTVRSAPLRLTVRDPATAPALTLVVPDSVALNGLVSLGISGLASSAADPVVRVDFFDDKGLLGTDATAPYTLDWRGSAVGTQALQARAVLRSGAVLNSDLRMVQVKRPGNRLPLVSISTPRAGAVISPSANAFVSVAASDFDGSLQSVSLYEGATLLGSTQATDLNGLWTFRISLPPGSHTLVARALDGDREYASSAPVTVTIANQSPTVGLQVPSTAVAGQLVTLASTPGDVDGLAVKVNFYDGTRLIGTRMRYPWAISWAPTAGTHVLTAQVSDELGAVGISPSRTLTVKASNNPPKIGLAGVTNGAILVPGTPVTLTTTPGDADGWITRVDFYDGASLIGSRTSRPWTLDWVPTAGTHVLSVQATDNDGAVSVPASVTVSAKTGTNTPPKARITAPAAGTVVSAGAVVTLTANPGDVDGWITRLEFYDGATLIGTRTSKPWAIDWSGGAGAHALSVKVFDNEGASSTSAPVSITVTP